MKDITFLIQIHKLRIFRVKYSHALNLDVACGL
jgi:hypothetical protein